MFIFSNLTGATVDRSNMQITITSTLTKFPGSETQYNGHSYFLSTLTPQNINIAQQLCEMYGGYVWEVNDKAERDHVIKFVKSLDIDTREHKGFLIIGATDTVRSGKWTFRHSGGEMTYLPWASSEPDDKGTSHCIVVNVDNKYFYDVVCVVNLRRRFVCEID